MALMFTSTSSIKKAVQLINDLDPSKFPLLLSRIVQKLHLKDERTFNEEEEERLQTALQLSSQDLDLVVETCEFFLHQSAYHTAKPALLSSQLLQLELNEEKVSALVDVWTNSARAVIEQLRKRTIAPKQLEDVNWRLHLQMATKSQAKLKQPVAMFEFGVKDESSESKEKIRVEFTHDELYQFYNQLETIQGQIDALS